MNDAIGSLRRVLGLAVIWAILWLAFWTIVIGIIWIVDPDSIDPGEGPMLIVVILGPMGLLSGLAVAGLVSMQRRAGTAIDLSLIRVAGWGVLGSAIVQVAYLGHGDAGLAANIKMALLFSAFGGVVTLVWFLMARTWLRRRSASQPAF